MGRFISTCTYTYKLHNVLSSWFQVSAIAWTYFCRVSHMMDMENLFRWRVFEYFTQDLCTEPLRRTSLLWFNLISSLSNIFNFGYWPGNFWNLSFHSIGMRCAPLGRRWLHKSYKIRIVRFALRMIDVSPFRWRNLLEWRSCLLEISNSVL